MNDLLSDESINRRDFFKLKFLIMFNMFFSNFLGVNIIDSSSKANLDYSVLDKLLELPFSEEVKQEITLRVNLQKKYSFDSRGYLQPLDRVLKEIIDFIIYSKNIKDFKLLCSIKDSQIDYTYTFNRSARRGALKQMKHIQNKLISTNNAMLNDALIYAFKSKSVKSVLHLLQSKIKIEESTQLGLVNLFKNDEYDMFQKELFSSTNMKFLPTVSIKDNLKKRKMSKKQIGYDPDDYFHEGKLYNIVYNSLVDLYMQYYIDDFSIKLSDGIVSVSLWNNKGIYPIDFINILDKMLTFNGFNQDDWSMGHYKQNMIEQINFIKKEEQKHRYFYEKIDDYLDYSESIYMEII